MQRFKTAATLQKFVSYHSQIYNHFNHERHLETRQTYKQKRSAALIEWFQICASWICVIVVLWDVLDFV